MKKEYDLIIVGSGLYGCVTAYLAHQAGWRCLVIGNRSFVSGKLHNLPSVWTKLLKTLWNNGRS